MKNLLSENMMRFGTKNLTEAAQKELVVKSIMETIEQHGLSNVIRKKLSEQADPNLGLAQKIVGMMWTGLSYSGGTDEAKIYKALKMITSKEIYKSVLTIVKTSSKIKAEWGKNFPTVMTWIETDTMSQDIGADDWSGDRAWLQKYEDILRPFNGNEVFSMTSKNYF